MLFRTVNPIYESPSTKLYHGDAIKVLSKFEDDTFDLIFADPPYNLSNGGFTCNAGKQVSVNKASWDKSRGFEADYAFHAEWIKACHRVLKPNGTLWISGTYHSIYVCGFALQKENWHIINDICWFKPNASPNLSCRLFTASHEMLLWAKKTKQAKQTFNYSFLKNTDWSGDFIKKPNKQMRSVWTIPTTPKSEKKYGKHPTQKPIALLERIILASSHPNALILDPFCGSATTGVAAIKHSRRFVGIDTEADYLKCLAIPRLKEAEKIAANIVQEYTCSNTIGSLLTKQLLMQPNDAKTIIR